MYIFPDLKQSRVSEEPKTTSGIRIGHVNLRVADLDRAVSFYCDVLGLSVIYDGPSVGIPTVFLGFSDYQYHVALTWFYNVAGDSKHCSRSGLNHFAIVYPDEPSLAAAVARLVDHGGLIDDARDHGSSLSIYLCDPDGNGIELSYDRPQSCRFDSAGEFVIKSEPFDVRKWLKDVWSGTSRVAHEKTRFGFLEVAV